MTKENSEIKEGNNIGVPQGIAQAPEAPAGAVATAAKVEKVPKVEAPAMPEGMVMVKSDDISTLIKKLDEQSKQIEVLFKTADKSRLQKYDEANNGALIKTVKVWIFEGKIVLATKLTSNRCEVIQGRWFEEQKVNVVFDDGSSREMDLLEFTRGKSYQKAEIIERRHPAGSEEMLKVLLPEGKEVELSVNFIN